MMQYRYGWKNNPKRKSMYNRTCCVIVDGGVANSVLVEFEDNGQREIVSKFALRPMPVLQNTLFDD